MKLVLQYRVTGVRLGAFNCHIPSTSSTPKRKEDTVKNLCKQLATVDALPFWVIGGDCNLSEILMKAYCQDYLEPHFPCISRSGRDMQDVRKADFAISQGINLEDVCSWVGFNTPPHVSNAHNMVPVIGTISSVVPCEQCMELPAVFHCDSLGLLCNRCLQGDMNKKLTGGPPLFESILF